MSPRLRRLLRRGFSLLELLLVLVILAILAGLAMPAYTSSIEKMRSAEAIEHLMNVRRAMQRHQLLNGSFSGATLSVTGTNLDFNPNLTGPGNNRIFSYRFSSGPDASTYTVEAHRIPDVGCSVFTPTYNVLMDQAGVIRYT